MGFWRARGQNVPNGAFWGKGRPLIYFGGFWEGSNGKLRPQGAWEGLWSGQGRVPFLTVDQVKMRVILVNWVPGPPGGSYVWIRVDRDCLRKNGDIFLANSGPRDSGDFLGPGQSG